MRYAFALTAALAAAPALAASPELYPSSAGELAVETLAGGLVNPWSLAFLPDGRMLVTERPGRMRIVTRAGALSRPVAGLPGVFARAHAGLMDVLLDRDFAQNSRVFFCYAEPCERGDPRMVAVSVIFRQHGPVSRGLNIGCRMVQAPDGNLFVTLGDHFLGQYAQKLDNHIGKIV